MEKYLGIIDKYNSSTQAKAYDVIRTIIKYLTILFYYSA